MPTARDWRLRETTAARFEGTVPPEYLAKLTVALSMVVGIRIVATYAGSLQRWSFRVCGLMEALHLIAITLGAASRS